MIIEYFLPFLNEHGIIISFLAGFITGETVIVSLAFLAATGVLPLWYVLVFCTLGMYFSDFVPFIIGRLGIFRKLFRGKTFKRTKKVEDVFLRYTKNNLFLALFYTKFIYGASIPALIYLGHKKTSYSKFAFYNIFVELIFVPLVVLIGWLSGKGFIISKTIFRDVRIGIFLVIVLFIVLFFVRKWINQLLIKRRGQ